MRQRATVRLTALLVFASNVAMAQEPGSTPTEDPAVNDALTLARQHFASHQYDAAFEACQQAVRTHPSAQLYRCMALARNGEGQVVDAERYATLALGVEGDPWLTTHRAAVEQMRGQFWLQLGRIEIRTNVAGATVLIDGADVGRAPLAEAIVVTAGRHRVVVQAEGYQSAHRDVEVAGTDASVTSSLSVSRLNVELHRELPAPQPDDVESQTRVAPPVVLLPSTTVAQTSPTDDAPSRVPLRRRWWLWTVVGVVVVAAVAVPLAVRTPDPRYESGTSGGVIFALGSRGPAR